MMSILNEMTNLKLRITLVLNLINLYRLPQTIKKMQKSKEISQHLIYLQRGNVNNVRSTTVNFLEIVFMKYSWLYEASASLFSCL